MILANQSVNLILLLVVIFSICSLGSQKALSSSIFLFLESLTINLYFSLKSGLTSIAFGTSLLLTFFTMMSVGSNLYFEISFNNRIVKAPKTNIILSVFLIFFFMQNINDFFVEEIEENQLYVMADDMPLIILGFSFFAILISSLIVFDMKNSKVGEQK